MEKAGKNSRDRFEHPLTERYASEEMSFLFSPRFKFSTWRRLWVALARAEKALGLPIKDSQIREMERYVSDINFEEAERIERQTRHDVMAHIKAYGMQAKSAAGIIHLGATSAYVTDNADLIQMREGLRLTAGKLAGIIRNLAAFAEMYAAMPILAYTHFQAAQPTTVGKRACLWIQDLLMDLNAVEEAAGDMPFLGVKGATGTQASFLDLFDGDASKVERLDAAVARGMGFRETLPVAGQTYTRKVDFKVLCALAGVGISAHKFANDLRLLCHMKEIEEPFEKDQVGSSAMAYKRNPMRAERMTALARHLVVLVQDAAFTACCQWLERTLDDSANKRIAVAEAFLTCDAILEIFLNVTSGLMVNGKVIERNLRREMAFMITENILMRAVKAGGDRQKLHARIRIHSLEAARRIKEGDGVNDLMERMASDPALAPFVGDGAEAADASRYTGMAGRQTRKCLREKVAPVLRRYRSIACREGRVRV
ncbi:MAG: adenylosuccinate lyase [Planctomycetota bacterium]|nr:adenylosuccinate lyase [Planctomycetota bacterium]